ncbi:MAG: DUF2169 domain-containing protein [Deltaproteobacteria bacterium]|nr:DUF2169 domain-containing protein [Deltaproteobacteria bacterium]
MTRAPVSQLYDAVVDFAPTRGHVPNHAYGLVKRTYLVSEGELTLAPAKPLTHDIRPGPYGELPESLPLGSDFWTYKRLTDVVVVGSAHAPGGRSTQHMEVRCDVGRAVKRIAVFGRRHIEWGREGRARIGSAEGFTTMPIDNAHAYGGIDTRVPYPPIRSLMHALELAADHPGAYPRNQDGKGYYVVPERFDGIELPNLENPDDLLTDERLVLGEPRSWGPQPIPWTFDCQPHGTFPRCLFFGKRPRLGVPADELTEVRMGMLDEQYELLLTDEPAESEQERAAREAFSDRFYQEASAGLQLAPLRSGLPVRVSGMRRDGAVLSFELPTPPSVELVIAGTVDPVEPMMTNLVIIPDEGQILITYCARSDGLPRKLIPGVHAHIPLSLRIDGAVAVTYDTPPPHPPAASASDG